MSDLLPCPFCGGKPYTRETQDEDLSTHAIVTWKFVGCHNCDVSFGIPDGYDCGTASEQWNTRAALEPVTVQQAALMLADHIDNDTEAASRMIEAYVSITSLDTLVSHWLSQCLRALAEKEP